MAESLQDPNEYIGLDDKLLLAFILGSIIIIVQNLYLFVSNLIKFEDQEYVFDTFYALIDNDLDYVVDIIGFLIIGVVLFLNNSKRSDAKKILIRSGVGFVLWAVFRSIWQFFLLSDSWENYDLFGDEDLSFNTELVLFLISVLFFTYALYNLFVFYTPRSKELTKKVDESWFLLLYLIVNLLSSILIFLNGHTRINFLEDYDNVDKLTYMPKLVIAPLFGAIAFIWILYPFLKEIQISSSSSK